MVDLKAEMAQLWASLGGAWSPPSPGHGRMIQFIGGRRGEGTSTVAREFARYAVDRVRRAVWLVDLDLLNNAQHAALAADPARFGALGRPAAASPDGSAFFTVQPAVRGQDGRTWPDAGYLVAHPVGHTRLWATRFRRESMRPDQTVHILGSGAYWGALRRYADLIVVDAPSLDRSPAGLAVAPFADVNVMVMSADTGDVRASSQLKEALTAAGARCGGIFFNRVTVEPPKFLKARS